MSDALRRAIRGIVQMGLAEALLRLLMAFGVALTEDQHVAILGALTPLVTLVQNLLEDNTGMPALLKGPASEGQNPVPDDAGPKDGG